MFGSGRHNAAPRGGMYFSKLFFFCKESVRLATNHQVARIAKHPGARLKGKHMLVLSRKLGERIFIGGVVLTVLKVHGGQVRLGLDAPCDVHPSRRVV